MNQKYDGFSAAATRRRFVGRLKENGLRVNLAGSFDYLEAAYYVSQELEALGVDIRPTCREMLDAYIPPIFLQKASTAGLAVPPWYISNGYFEPPVVIDPINPFMFRSRTVWKRGREHAIAKSMTRNYTYAICCQELPDGCRIKKLHAVLGRTTSRAFVESARAAWEVFGIPLATVRVILTPERKPLISDISPLPFAALGARELAWLEGAVEWDD